MSANGRFTAAERGSATKPGAGSPAPFPELKGILPSIHVAPPSNDVKKPVGTIT